MKLKNNKKVEIANQILAHAKQLGFDTAFITFEVEDEEYYEDIDSIASDHNEGDELEIHIHLVLDENLEVEIDENNDLVYK